MTDVNHKPNQAQTSTVDPEKRIATLEAALRKKESIETILRRNQAMLAHTESIAHIGSWEWEVATDTVTWSDELFNIFQLDPAAGAPSFAEHSPLYPPQDMARLSEAVETALHTGAPYELELRAIRTDGAVRVCLARGYAEVGPDGSVERLVGSFQDITERKQAVEALRESNERLQRAESVAHFGNWELDLTERKIRASAGAGIIYGLPGEEWSLADVQGLPLPEYRALMDAALTHLIEHNQPYNVEFRIRRPGDGQLRDIHSMAEYDPDRGVVFGVLNDITERKRAETALRESEEKYSLMVANISDVIAIMGPDGLMKYKSPNIEKFFGWRPEDLVGGDGRHTVHPADLERIQTEFLALLEKDNLRKTVEYRYKCKDNRYKWIQLTAVNLTNDPLIDGVLMNYHDITERKQAEVALRESEERFHRLADNAPDIIFRYDLIPEMKLAYINPAVQAMTGYTSAECYADPYLMFNMANPDDAGIMVDYVQKRTPPDRPLLMRWIGKDGVTRWMESRIVSVYDAAGQLAAVEGITRDITEQMQAEEARVKLEAQTRQIEKAESLGRMAGAIAHHFNNQLQAVMGNLELAMMSKTSSQNLSQAMVSAERAAEMSSLMLVYLGQTPDDLEPLDLVSTCARSLTPLRETLPSGVTLEADLAGPGPVINANATRIRQLLTNLVTNAREALGDGPGSIQLTLKTVPSADIPTTHRFPFDWQPQAQDYACLAVTDSGVGIATEDIEKLFDPFFSTKFTGRGLGLAVVLGIVRGHSGAVTVESRPPGRGSAFRFFFPAIAQAAPAPPPAQAAHPPATAEGGTVLLVEDEETVRHIVAEMLGILGFTVLTAVDGVEAVELFRQHQAEIDCVLCDLTMPRMDGWATLTALRQLSPDIPVILSSGYDEAHVMAGSHSERLQAFLSKPYQMSKMSQVIRGVLAARKK